MAGALALYGSCNKNEPSEPEINELEDGITAIAAHYSADTKVSMTDHVGSDVVSVAFKAGDKLQVLRVSSISTAGVLTGFAAAAIPFTISTGMGTKTGIFHADGSGLTTTGVYVAVHPGANNSFGVTTGATGYFTISLPDVQTPGSPADVFSNAEDYMCFLSASPIEIVDPTTPPATANPVTFPLAPLTSVARLHVEDAGGYTSGRILKSITVISKGDSYFGTKVSIFPSGAYHATAPATHRENTNIKTLDLNSLSGGGMTVTSTLSQAGCLALYCVQDVYSSVTGYAYILEFDNGTYFVTEKPKVRPWLPGAVYEVGLTVDGALTSCVAPIGVSISASATTGIPGTPITLTATATPAAADATLSLVQWEQLVNSTWQAIPGATGVAFNTAIMASSNTFRVSVTGCSSTVVSAPLTIAGNPGLPITVGDPLPDSYVGAFWKAGEKGERIIRIPITNSLNSGPWSVSAVWWDSQWLPAFGNGIVVDFDKLGDAEFLARGITWNAGTENPNMGANDPENHLVNNTPIVGGVAATGDTIQFRIGLQQSFGAFNAQNNPARYALVVISYGTPARAHRIFIRQGEGDDYLMRPQDGGGGGPWGSPNPRPHARKFSPFNLTAPTGYVNPTSVITIGNPNNGVPVKGGELTTYPTQAGYLFRWNYNRQAFAPHLTITLSGWGSGQEGNGIWVADIHETCPQGYRRPNDGAPPTVGVVASSELRQSLWQSPLNFALRDNFVWGYYADGFFDRREVRNAPGTFVGTNSSVSISSNTIAHAGSLFFNPTTQASLFFPASGGIAPASATLSSSGRMVHYWTNTASDSGNAYTIYSQSNFADASLGWTSAAFPVRCIACAAVTHVTISPANPPPLEMGGVVELTASVTPNGALNVSYTWERSVDGGATWQIVPGATGASHHALAELDGVTRYRCAIRDDCGASKTSNEAHVTGFGFFPDFDLSLASVNPHPAYDNYKIAPNKWKLNGSIGPDLYAMDKIVVTSAGIATTDQKFAVGIHDETYFHSYGNTFSLSDGILVKENGVYSVYLANEFGGIVKTITVTNLRDGSPTKPYLLMSSTTASAYAPTVTGIDAFTLSFLSTGYLGWDFELYESISAGAWTPPGALFGAFNGNNHTITMTVNVSSDHAGFFTGIDGGSVVNLKIAGSIKSTNPSGAIGSIAGYNRGGTIHNCFNSATIDGKEDVGGIVGYNYDDAIIMYCGNSGDVTGELNWTGGIASRNEGSKILSCYNTATVKSTGYNTGGIVGESSHGNGAGSGNAMIEKCYNTGDVISTGTQSGGITAVNIGGAPKTATIQECYNRGAVTGTIVTGGIVGFNAYAGAIVRNSYNVAAVNSNSYGGGIAGDNSSAQIETCFNTGEVTSAFIAGGIVGYQGNGTIINCYALNSRLTVASSACVVGRVVGSAASGNTLTNNYAISTMGMYYGSSQFTVGPKGGSTQEGADVSFADATATSAAHYKNASEGNWSAFDTHWTRNYPSGYEVAPGTNLPILRAFIPATFPLAEQNPMIFP